MLLVLVQQTGDVALARALDRVIGDELPLFLLFARSDLKERYGSVRHKHGFDAAMCMLNPTNFDAVVSFAAPCDPRLMQNLFVVSYFDEIGIPTIEIQHGLFQYGINNVDVGLQVGSSPERGDQMGIHIEYAAKKVLRWGGEDGIGYLKSELAVEAPANLRGEFVLVTTNQNWHVYSDKHRYQLAIAIVRLAMSRPDLRFVWKPHHAENGTPEAKRVLTTVQEYELPNIEFEHSVPAEALIPSCKAAITTVSTTLIDYQTHRTPTAVFACEPVAHLVEQLRCVSFSNAIELQHAWAALERSPQDALVETGVGPVRRERLVSELRDAIATRRLRPDWLRVALQYQSYIRQPRSAHREMRRIEDSISEVKKRVNVVHRSTIAYKMKKLGQRLGVIR